jgi:uncharacterized iron-regulated protein
MTANAVPETAEVSKIAAHCAVNPLDKMFSIRSIHPLSLTALLAVAMLAACTASVESGISRKEYQKPRVLHQQQTIAFPDFADGIRGARAVLVGETHDRLDHHLNQLEIIRGLHESGARLAIGMEAFQQPFQPHLDDYIDGRIDAHELLRRTEYYERWQYDFRLYEPVLRYAREHGIPVRALNAPRELTELVSRHGLDGLDTDAAQQLPEIDRSDEEYRERLRLVFEDHAMDGHGPSFEAFYGVQLLWDEAMAANAAAYLADHPDRSMVIIAGLGHIDYGSGIPRRLARRLEGELVTVTHADPSEDPDQRADYVLLSQELHLPKRGLLGVFIQPGDGGTRIQSLGEDSAAGAAGMQAGDVITAVAGHQVGSFADLRAAMWDRMPGDQVSVTAKRGDHQTLEFEVVLR